MVVVVVDRTAVSHVCSHWDKVNMAMSTGSSTRLVEGKRILRRVIVGKLSA